MKMKNPQILEIIHMKKTKTPLYIEMPVPEKSFPYLVGNPKKEKNDLLKWVEALYERYCSFLGARVLYRRDTF